MRITSIEGARGPVDVKSKEDLVSELNHWIGSVIGVIWLESEERSRIVARYSKYSVYIREPEIHLFNREEMNGEELIKRVVSIIDSSMDTEIFWIGTDHEVWISGVEEQV